MTSKIQNQLDEENFPFFSEFITEECRLGNIIGLHGYLAAVNCHTDQDIQQNALADVFTFENERIIASGDKYSSEDVEKFNTLFNGFNQGIKEDLENEMLNPVFFIGLLDCDIAEVIKLWAQAFIYGGRLNGNGFLEQGDSEVSEIIFPIVLQISDQEDNKIAELADEFDPAEVREDAANHIEDCLSELYQYLREEKIVEIEEIQEEQK